MKIYLYLESEKTFLLISNTPNGKWRNGDFFLNKNNPQEELRLFAAESERYLSKILVIKMQRRIYATSCDGEGSHFWAIYELVCHVETGFLW